MKRILLLTLASVLYGSLQPPSFRLPIDGVPTRYSLEMRLDPAKNDFSGVITIELKIERKTSVIWLNSAKLNVSAGSLEQGGSKQSARILPGGDDFVGFEFDQPLETGTARLAATFTGDVNLKSGAGIFLSKRNDDRYLFTQFEPIDARAAFPCFDEPSFKVPWQVRLHIPTGLVAVSNTPIQSEKEEAQTKTVVFEETKPLPSYLIAFAVGPLEFVDGGKACRKKIPVRIVVPRGDGPRAKYAASVTADILTRLEEYFDIPYPFEKADQVSIPLSFGGAMENPGLVTYDARIILAPPAGNDPIDRQRSYVSIATHELAHQWFGDLVTMAWWNDTWLNESFATFMQQKIEASWKPEWQTKVEDQDARIFAMWLDRLETARRIDQPVDAKQEIGNAFDGITYQKGASVLQMFDHSMGPAKFRDAVRFYLNKHANGNGTANDFLEALGEYGGPHVPESFRTFLQQAGVPQVDMALKCGGSEAHIEMSQQRFRPLGAPETGAQSWQIPVCVAYEKDGKRATQCAALNDRTGNLALETKACPAWVLGNADEVGYYYTRYEPSALENLIASREQLSLPERVGLFGEIANLHVAGRVLPSQALQLAARLRDDPRRQIVSSALKLADVRLDYLPPDLRPKYAHYVQENFGARARQLGWLPRSGDMEDDRLIRPELVGFVAREGEDRELIASATELTNKWLNTRAVLPAETMRSIFEVAARNGDAALHEKILTAIKTEKDEFYLQALFRALASFRQKELVEKNLQLLAAGEFDWRLAYPILLAPQDTPGIERLPLEVVKSNYDSMVTKMPRGVGSDYAAFLPYAAESGCTTQDAEEAQTFFGPRMAKVDGGVRNLAQTVERIKLCEARKKVQQPDLVHFFGS